MSSVDVVLYTDGAARGNPGPGGYGLILQSGHHYKEISEGFRYTTNNRMELLSVIVGLEMLKKPGMDVLVYSDSQYVVNSIEKKWIDNWVKKNWKGVKNDDLWKRFLPVYKSHKVKFKWVRGHAGHPMNERCDELAVAASYGSTLHVDDWYENNS